MSLRDFIKEIGLPEFKSVIGRGGSKIFFLILISFISLIAMGLANGCLNYLEEKMNDPWVQFIDVPHLWNGGVEKGDGGLYPEFDIDSAKDYMRETDKVLIQYKKELEDITKEYKEANQEQQSKLADALTSSKEKLQAQKEKWESQSNKIVFRTYVKTARFVNAKTKEDLSLEGFKISSKEDPFYKELENRNSKIRGKFHKESWGIIVSEYFLKSLGLPIDAAYATIKTGEDEFPVPISGVVQSLRNNKEFIMSEYLYSFLYSYTERISEIKSDSVQTEAIWFLKDSIAKNKDVINNLNNQGFKKYDIGLSFSIPHVNGVFLSSDSFGLDISSFGAIRVYDFNVIDLNIENKSSAPDDYTLLFDEPDDVLIFSEYLKNEFGIRLEESKMEAKKNFAFFNVLSRLLSFALVAFSIISIIFFILNLLLAHINRNKRNLGTLKAFGLANKHIILLYVGICY